LARIDFTGVTEETMNYSEAVSIAQAMYEASEIQDPELALAEVMRDLTRVARIEKYTHSLL
jgi:hypothetical protein